MRIDAILHVDEQKLAAKFGTRIETGGGTMVQADWAQNDETAVDYVKNRPGGYYGDPVTVNEEIYNGKIERAQSEMQVDWLLVAGQTCKVTIGEEEKTYTAFADSYSGISGVTIGDATIKEALGAGEIFALMSVEIENQKAALIVSPNADVGKTIRIARFGTVREAHKIPTELLEMSGIDEKIQQMNTAFGELSEKHTSDISAINKMLSEGPIKIVDPRKTSSLILGQLADGGLRLRWDVSDGSYCYMNRDGFVVMNKTYGTSISVVSNRISIVEQTKGSGIRFNLEEGDLNGGTRFSVGNVAGDLTTFYASGKIINNNKIIKFVYVDNITENNATTLRGVKTPEQDYDAANKKYVDARLPSPTTAQPGQIVRVKAVDADGRITETEAIAMPVSKSLKWITVHTSTLTEEATEIVVSTDANGDAIASYNPIGLILVLSTPADATQTDNNGSPWVYPSSTKFWNDIRVIGNISEWKNIARDNVFAFYGGGSAMSCTGNINMQLPTYKVDGYILDGVKVMLHGNANHFPVGTHVEVSILCEMPGENEMPA